MNLKARQIIANVEPALFEAANEAASQQGMSRSAYLRKLLIQDLLTRNLISDEAVDEILAI